VKWALGLALAAAAGLMLFVLARGFGRDPHEVPFMLRGKPAPAFTLRRLDSGATVTLADLKGKPVVLNFWASWCAPCKVEHPVLAWGARRFASEAQFYGVVFEDTEENARAFATPIDPAFPQLFEERARMAVDYGLTGVPETYFIDAAGIVRDKFVGPIDARSLAQRIAALRSPLPPVSAVAR
jgi:cytochrome c biogenesis protein CcmG, thiol:disulfide interchange protein DsbE